MDLEALILDSAIITCTEVITLAMAITMGLPLIIQVIDYIIAIALTIDVSEK
jgi:hypothetical protein